MAEVEGQVWRYEPSNYDPEEVDWIIFITFYLSIHFVCCSCYWSFDHYIGWTKITGRIHKVLVYR